MVGIEILVCNLKEQVTDTAQETLHVADFSTSKEGVDSSSSVSAMVHVEGASLGPYISADGASMGGSLGGTDTQADTLLIGGESEVIPVKDGVEIRPEVGSSFEKSGAAADFCVQVPTLDTHNSAYGNNEKVTLGGIEIHPERLQFRPMLHISPTMIEEINASEVGASQ